MENSEKKEMVAEGKYTALLEKYEEKENSKGTGRRGVLTFRIAGKSPFRGRKLNLGLNVEHTSEGAQKVATDYLNKFLKATGEAPEGLESIGYDRSELANFNSSPVTIVVKHKMGNSYVNRDGEQIPERLRAEIVDIQEKA